MHPRRSSRPPRPSGSYPRLAGLSATRRRRRGRRAIPGRRSTAVAADRPTASRRSVHSRDSPVRARGSRVRPLPSPDRSMTNDRGCTHAAGECPDPGVPGRSTTPSTRSRQATSDRSCAPRRVLAPPPHSAIAPRAEKPQTLSRGPQLESQAHDAGSTWGPPVLDVRTPCCPARAIRRSPGTKVQLMGWTSRWLQRVPRADRSWVVQDGQARIIFVAGGSS